MITTPKDKHKKRKKIRNKNDPKLENNTRGRWPGKEIMGRGGDQGTNPARLAGMS